MPIKGKSSGATNVPVIKLAYCAPVLGDSGTLGLELSRTDRGSDMVIEHDTLYGTTKRSVRPASHEHGPVDDRNT